MVATSFMSSSYNHNAKYRSNHVRFSIRGDGPEGPGTHSPFPLLDLNISLLKTADLRQLSPVQLAFIGDAVYELHARTLFSWPLVKPQVHRSAAVQLVRAETQSVLLRRLIISGWAITDEERMLLRKGRNSAGPGPPRLSGGTYGEASALETLLGYLYMSDRPRLQSLLDELLRLGGDGSPRPGDELTINWKDRGEYEEDSGGKRGVTLLEEDEPDLEVEETADSSLRT